MTEEYEPPVIIDKPDGIRAFAWLQVYYKLKLEVEHPEGPHWRDSPMKQAKAIMAGAGIEVASQRKKFVLEQYEIFLERLGILQSD